MDISLLTTFSSFMFPAMITWISLGISSLLVSLFIVWRDKKQLNELVNIASQARGSDYPGKVRLRGEIVLWVDEYAKKDLQRWVYTAHNTALTGGMTDASALTDSIWSQERERFGIFRFLSRYSIMLGLLFTSAGLCITLASIAPALQTSGLAPDAWIRVVQTAMSKALGGMSTSFYSSLFGIGNGLILNLLGLFTIYPYHERYLKDIDVFVQGTLIPIFTSIVEKDRNDVIIEVMEHTEKSFKSVQEQYSQVLNYYIHQVNELKELRIDTKEMSNSLSENTRGLSEQIIKFASATISISNFTLPIAKAIETGLDGIEKAQNKSNEQFDTIQRNLFEPFTKAISKQFLEQQNETRQVIGHIENVSSDITELNKLMGISLKQITSDFSEQVEITREASQVTIERVKQLEDVLGQSTLEQFQKITEQTNSLKEIALSQTNLTDTLRNSLETMSLSKESQEKKVVELYDLHRIGVENLYSQIGDRLGETIQNVTQEGLTDVGKYFASGLENSIKITHEKLTGIHKLFSELADSHNNSLLSVQSLEKVIRMNENDLRNDLDKRRLIIDDILSQAVEKTGQGMKLSFENGIQQMKDRIESMLDESLNRQEGIVIDLNEVIGKKWDDLMTAATSVIS